MSVNGFWPSRSQINQNIAILTQMKIKSHRTQLNYTSFDLTRPESNTKSIHAHFFECIMHHNPSPLPSAAAGCSPFPFLPCLSCPSLPSPACPPISCPPLLSHLYNHPFPFSSQRLTMSSCDLHVVSQDPFGVIYFWSCSVGLGVIWCDFSLI